MTQPLTSLSLDCPAKVNLALSVGAPRPELGGLHPIASWMLTLRFGDHLTLRAIQGQDSRFDLAFDPLAPRVEAIDWPLEKDLAYRAHGLLESYTGRRLPVEAVLRKRVPTGAGLGGGSSDAAGMLVGLNRLFNLELDAPTLCELAGKLGSDVVFLTAAVAGGMSGALVLGTGDLIEPAPPARAIDLVLIFPPHHSPTGPVYRAFDEIAGDAEADEERVRHLISKPTVGADDPFNDLAEPAMRVTPPLRLIQQHAAEAIGRTVHVTGSGAAMFALADGPDHALQLAQRISNVLSIPAIATRTTGP